MDMDYFYYYGQIEQQKEISANLDMHIRQPQRSLFYYRSCGSELTNFENNPISLITKILLKYSLVKSIAQMNANVPDGSNNLRDLRVITSQNLIDVETNGSEIDIKIQYLPMYDAEQKDKIEISLGGL